MKPIDEFFYCRQNYLTPDTSSLMRFYYPLMGDGDLGLYLYFASFFDNGSQRHKFSEILNHMQFGMQAFEASLARLTALDLVAFYRQQGVYLIQLKPPLTAKDFLANPVYSRQLEQKIGQVALGYLALEDLSQSEDLSKDFSEVFGGERHLNPKQAPSSKTQFDLDSFKNRMTSDGLRFSDPTKDVLGLNQLSEQYHLSWYDTYLLAKETAHRGVISLSRMRAKKEQPQAASGSQSFSPEELAIIQEAKASTAEHYLANIKKLRHATITADERQLLDDLAEMSFLDEVINMMVLYTVNKSKSANLNKTYLMKVANDFAYQGVSSAEAALEKIRSFKEPQKKASKSRQPKSNVPEWSNQEYKNETSAEEQARLEAIKRQTLERLRKGEE